MEESQNPTKFTGHRPYKKRHTHYICYIKVEDEIPEKFKPCNGIFEDFESLAKHNNEIHNWSLEHCCYICELYVKNRCEFLAHTIFHLKELYSQKDSFCCEACEKMYKNIFANFNARNCYTFSPVTLKEDYFDYYDLTPNVLNKKGIFFNAIN